ncbi:MAG: MFS transporter [Chloroflexi bacterium]|nr:MFS transporter [Chloroflexota bacterium]
MTEDTDGQATSGTVLEIPWIVKRNTILLALSQALVGTGTHMVPALGPLLSVELIGSAALAGAAVSIVGVSRFIVAYPLGKIMDVYGRRAGLMLGLAVAIVGTVVTGTSVISHSFPIFVIGMLIFGLGMGAAQQIRLAAADMYPPSRRAEGLGFVLTGSLIGAFGGPVIISVAQSLSPGLGLPPLATPWLLVPAMIVPTIVLVSRMRPDPKEIATHLDRYYPGHKAADSAASMKQGRAGIGAFIKHYPKRVAFVASFGAQGTMTMVMAMTSLALAGQGHPLPAISLSVTIHVLGMFAFSLPLGKLSDAVGRRSVLAAGAVITILGALLVPASPDYWVITLGTFLVGLGWSCINVASTAVIADTTRPHERGRAIGVNDVFSSASGIVLPMVAGPLVDNFSLNSIGILGALVMIAPLLLLIRLREPAPGKYEDVSVLQQKL